MQSVAARSRGRIRSFLVALAVAFVALLGLTPTVAHAVQVRYRIGTPSNPKDVYIRPDATAGGKLFIPLTYEGKVPSRWVKYDGGQEVEVTAVEAGDEEKVYYARWNGEAADGPTADASKWRRFTFVANRSDVTDPAYERQFKNGGNWLSDEAIATAGLTDTYNEYASGVRGSSSGQLPFEIRLVRKFAASTPIPAAVEAAGEAYENAKNSLSLRINYYLPDAHKGDEAYVVTPNGWWYWDARVGLAKTFSFENRSARENEGVVYDDGQTGDFTIVMRLNHNSEYVTGNYFPVRFVSQDNLVAVQAVMKGYTALAMVDEMMQPVGTWTPQALDPSDEITSSEVAAADAATQMNTWLVQRDLTSTPPYGYSALRGWSIDPNGTNAYSFFPDTTVLNASSNLTLFALWDKITYQLDIDLEGGSFAPGTGTGWDLLGGTTDEYRYEDTFTIESDAVTLPAADQLVPPSGYVDFLGWYLEDGTGPIETVPDDIPANKLDDIKLVAKWGRAVTINVHHYVRQLAGDNHQNNELSDSVVEFSTVEKAPSKANDRIDADFANEYALGNLTEQLQAAADKLATAGYDYTGKYRAVLPGVNKEQWLNIFPERVPNLSESLINATLFVPDAVSSDAVLDLYLYYTPRIYHVMMGTDENETAVGLIDKLTTQPINGTTNDYYRGARVNVSAELGQGGEGYGLPITWDIAGGGGEVVDSETPNYYIVTAPEVYDPQNSTITLTPSATYIEYATVTFYTGPTNETVGDPVQVKYGDRVSVPIVVKNGEVADYWTTEPSPSGALFNLTSVLTKSMTDEDDNLKLYAWWDDTSDDPAARRTVKFVAMGRTVASVNVLAGSKLETVLADPEMAEATKTRLTSLVSNGVTRNNATFEGWYPLSIGGGFADTQFGMTTTVDQDTTVYAKYTANGPDDEETPVGPTEYIVTFKVHAADAAPYAVKTVAAGSSLTTAKMPVDPTPDEGKHFSGWVLNDQPFDASTNVSSDITVYANMVELYTVTFKGRLYLSDGITLAEADPITLGNPATVESGKTVAAPDVAMNGYNLDGWYVETGGAIDSSAYRFSTPVTSNLVLVAKFIEDDDPETTPFNRDNRAYVTFMSGDLVIKVVDVPKDTKDAFSAPDIARENYQLSWRVETEDGDEFSFDPISHRNVSTVSKDTVLMAGWLWDGPGEEPPEEEDEKAMYQVKFVSEGKLWRADVVKEGDKVARPTTTDLKNSKNDSLVVVGWSENPSEHATTGYDFDQEVTRDLTLYARWGQPGTVWTVTFDSNGGTPVDIQFVEDGGYASEPTSEQEGYILRGWFKGTESNKFDFETRPITESTRLSARWNLNPASIPVRVTFISNGEVLDVREADESGIVEPLDVVREGNKLLGWYDNEALTGNPVDFTKPFTEDKSVYAKWEKELSADEDIVKVNYYAYNVEDAKPYMTELVDMGGHANRPVDPTLANHTFGHWATYAGANGYQEFAFRSDGKSVATINQDVDLYAIWTDSINPISNTVWVVAFASEGEAAGEIVHMVYAEDGSKLSDPTEELYEKGLLKDRDGYTPSNWIDIEGNAFDFENDTVKGNMTLTKHYEPITYTISYTSNNVAVQGYNLPSTYTVASNDIILPTLPDQANYTFLGWTVETDGPGMVSPNGLGTGTYDGLDGELETPLNFYTRIARGSWGNLKAVARWQPARYQVQLTNGDGTSGYLDVIYKTAIRYYAPDSQQAVEVTADEGFSRPTRDDLAVTFVGNGGTVELAGDDARPAQSATDSTRTIPFAFTGYTQLGGAQQLMLKPKDATVGAPVVLNSETFNNETVLTGVSECTFVAGWELTQANDAVLPTAFRPGYDFDGWWSTPARGTGYGTSGDSYNFAALSNDLNMYAAWKAHGYTITYKQADGETDDTTVTLAGQTLSDAKQAYTIANTNLALATPAARTGYSFMGWNLALADGSASGRLPDPASGPYKTINLASESESQRAYGNLVATPEWAPHSYVISLDLAGLTLTNSADNPATTQLIGTYGDASDGGVKLALGDGEGNAQTSDGEPIVLSDTQGVVVPERTYYVMYEPTSPKGAAAVTGVPDDVDRVRYVFDGYYYGDIKVINADGKLVALMEGSEPTAAGVLLESWNNAGATRDLTLIPQWYDPVSRQVVSGPIGLTLPSDDPEIQNDSDYVFDGWGLEEVTGNANRVKHPDTLPIDGSTSLQDGDDYIVYVYPQWNEVNAYTITYVSAGPRNASTQWEMTDENVAAQGVFWLNESNNLKNPNLTTYKSSDVTLTNPASNGYAFTGWSWARTNPADTDARAVLQQNSAGTWQLKATGSDVSKGNITLIAQWSGTPTGYQAHARLDGGVLSDVPSGWSYETDDTEAISDGYTIESTGTNNVVAMLPVAASLSKGGHIFGGWRLDGASGQTTTVVKGTDSWRVTVETPADGFGRVESSYTFVVTPGTDGALDDALVQDDQTGAIIADPAASVGVEAGSWGNASAVATWSPKKYVVSFDKNFDGSGTNSDDYPLAYGEELALSNVSPYQTSEGEPADTRTHTIAFDLVYRDPVSTDPTKTVSYEFAGWSTDGDAAPDDDSVLPASDVVGVEDLIADPDTDTGTTLHAIWNTSAVSLPQAGDKDYQAFLTRDGYGLVGWVEDESVAQELTRILSQPEDARTAQDNEYLEAHQPISEITPSQDAVTVYAVWEGALYPITYRSMVTSDAKGDWWQLSVGSDATGLAKDNAYGLTWPAVSAESSNIGEYAAGNPNPNPTEFMAVSLGVNDSVPLIDPHRDGYEFLGWEYGWENSTALHKASDTIPAAIPARYFPTTDLGAIVTAHWAVEEGSLKINANLPSDGVAIIEVSGTVDAYELQSEDGTGERDGSFKTVYTLASQGESPTAESTISLPAGTYTIRLLDAAPWGDANSVSINGPWKPGYTTSSDRVSNLDVDSSVDSRSHSIGFSALANTPASGRSAWVMNMLDTNATS